MCFSFVALSACLAINSFITLDPCDVQKLGASLNLDSHLALVPRETAMKEIHILLVKDGVFVDNFLDLSLIFYCLQPLWSGGSNEKAGLSSTLVFKALVRCIRSFFRAFPNYCALRFHHGCYLPKVGIILNSSNQVGPPQIANVVCPGARIAKNPQL